MVHLRIVPPPLRRHDRGSAMVEFAIVAPILFTLALGITDVAATTLAKYQSSNASQAMADLATQSPNLQTSDMADIYAGAADVMAPFSSATLVLRITSIASDGNGHLFVHWSCGQGTLTPFIAKSYITTLANSDAASNIMYPSNTWYGGYNYNGTNTTIIQVESQYVYTPPTGFVIKTAQTMVSAFYTYVRQSAYVGFPWDGTSSNQPTAPASTTKTASVTLSNGAVCNYAY